MIIKSSLVSSTDSETFLARMSEAVRSFQEEGLTVEVDYRPVGIESHRSFVLYSALIHGKQENPNG